MNRIRWTGIALVVAVVIAGFTRYYEDEFSVAQASTDRQTVDCLTQEMTHDEKVRLARFTAVHDVDGMQPVYTDVLSRCIVRSDQWDRRSEIVAGARQALSYDTEFRQLVSASSMQLARRP